MWPSVCRTTGGRGTGTGASSAPPPHLLSFPGPLTPPQQMGHGVQFVEGRDSDPKLSSLRRHIGGAHLPVQDLPLPPGTPWACRSFVVSSQGLCWKNLWIFVPVSSFKTSLSGYGRALSV